MWKDPNCNSCATIEFKKDGTVASNGSVVSGYTWKFSGNKENLEETFTYGGFSSTGTTKILRLTSKDLWLQDSGSSTVDKYVAQ